ncbi:MAG: L-aspartate oxidase [Actinomycetota bacterium]|nr:MAG: L-aspartate oxidase [Actinomycetota bacterium]
MEELFTDILIIGSGVAGSYAAMHAASLGAEVSLVTKTKLLSGATRWAQGGIAFPSDPNDIPSHLMDTVKAGRGLVDERVSAAILTDALTQWKHLVELGINFDALPALEGGHSKPRVLHIHGDESGLHLLTFLHSQLPPGVSTFENHFAAELCSVDGQVHGAILWKNGDPDKPVAVHAGATIIATGGIGQIYSLTTNPEESTGDGIALAYRTRAKIRDVELVQFHPTVLSNGGLISEACRGEGAILLNGIGERFMPRYDQAAELAPRDIVSSSIHSEIIATGKVFLDLRPVEDLKHKFPTVYNSILDLGFDPLKEPIPIQPAAHFLMGGVSTDEHGATSVANLFAAGEVASTGFHGANRLASNSLLEGLVMGSRTAGKAVASEPAAKRRIESSGVPGCAAGHQRAIRHIMANSASVVREEKSLTEGYNEMLGIEVSQAQSLTEAETANMRLLALMVLKGALERRESRGSHLRSDFPHTSPDAKHIEQQAGNPGAIRG